MMKQKRIKKCPVCHRTPEINACPEYAYIIYCETPGCPMNCRLNDNVVARHTMNSVAYERWPQNLNNVNFLINDWNKIVDGVKDVMKSKP